LITPIS